MKFILLLIAIVPFAMGCDKILLGKDEPIISLEENLRPPPALNDGWEVSDLSAQNIKAEPIHQLIKGIQNNPLNIHSLIIIRNNKLVSESYFTGWHRKRLHTLRSVSKSFVSTLMGIAIDKGYISNVNQKVFDFFPEYSDLNNAQKNNIEIKHFLTMTSGLQWDEKTYQGTDFRNDEFAFDESDDRLRFLFNRAVITQPGNSFVYNSAGPVVMASIIKKTTGDHVDVFAEKNLFSPLSITNYYWRKHSDGLITAIGPLFLCSRDMAKLGQLFLDGGKWKGRQIVSANWVTNATATYIGNEESATGYGYNWWTANYTVVNNPVRVIFARGSGGQYIFVVPGLNAVVVFTCGNFYPLNQGAPVGILINAILPAMQ